MTTKLESAIGLLESAIGLLRDSGYEVVDNTDDPTGVDLVRGATVAVAQGVVTEVVKNLRIVSK